MSEIQTKVYNFISDPGHGWLEVPVEEVKALALDITPYSYVDNRKGLAYLEEDLDAGVFVNAAAERDGLTVSEWCRERVNSRVVEWTHIRNLPRWEG